MTVTFIISSTYTVESTKETDRLPAVLTFTAAAGCTAMKTIIYCLELAAKGYVVFNMSYRLYPEVGVQRTASGHFTPFVD